MDPKIMKVGFALFNRYNNAKADLVAHVERINEDMAAGHLPGAFTSGDDSPRLAAKLYVYAQVVRFVWTNHTANKLTFEALKAFVLKSLTQDRSSLPGAGITGLTEHYRLVAWTEVFSIL